MRRYLVLAVVRNILVYRDPKEVNPKKLFTVPTEEIVAVLGKYPDLLEAVVEVMRGQDGVKVRDPRIVHQCELHEHWPRRSCAYMEDVGRVNVEDTGKQGLREKEERKRSANQRGEDERHQGRKHEGRGHEGRKDEANLGERPAVGRKKSVRFEDVPDGRREESS